MNTGAIPDHFSFVERNETSHVDEYFAQHEKLLLEHPRQEI